MLHCRLSLPPLIVLSACSLCLSPLSVPFLPLRRILLKDVAYHMHFLQFFFTIWLNFAEFATLSSYKLHLLPFNFIYSNGNNTHTHRHPQPHTLAQHSRNFRAFHFFAIWQTHQTCITPLPEKLRKRKTKRKLWREGSGSGSGRKRRGEAGIVLQCAYCLQL